MSQSDACGLERPPAEGRRDFKTSLDDDWSMLAPKPHGLEERDADTTYGNG